MSKELVLINPIVKILMERDDMLRDEAEELVDELKGRVYAGENPEDLLQDELGLEPDYLYDLI